jgi:hypothetical protein
MKLVNYDIKGNERRNFIHNMVRQKRTTKWVIMNEYVRSLQKKIDDERYWHEMIWGKCAVDQEIKYEIVSELAPCELVITFQQLEKERRREIRENILNPRDKLTTFTIRDDYISKHQKKTMKIRNDRSNEWKGKP